jgi:putative ABC transport system permease protein
MAAGGLAGGQGTPFLLGVSIVLVSLVPVARALGMPDRAAYTLGGMLVVVWWLLPAGVVESVTGDLKMDFSVWIVSGILIVVGATWTVMYNADLILSGVAKMASRARSVAPIAKMAVAYPLRSKGRTGMTLAMFMLVVFTLVTGTTISGSFISSFDDVEGFSGGFAVRAVAAPVRPIEDFDAALDELGADRSQIEAVGMQSYVPVEAKQVGTANPLAAYPVRGLVAGFLETTTYDLSAVGRGYASDREVWAALEDTPGLAVVDGMVAPRRNNYMMMGALDFKLEGFYVEDRVFDPVHVSVVDPATGARLKLTVIGVLGDDVPNEMAGLSTSQAALGPLGDRARPTTFWLRTAPGVDATATASSLESALLSYGLEAESLGDMLDERVAGSWTFNRLIQGFMGLGLVVGVVALGVISARAVVERRQQIGVLRAIGFQPGMVRLAFLAEASFISLTAIVTGTVLGLILSYNVIADAGAEQSVAFVVPWADLLVVFAVVQLAALASTLLPAIRGSRVYPAEALRYQ